MNSRFFNSSIVAVLLSLGGLGYSPAWALKETSCEQGYSRVAKRGSKAAEPQITRKDVVSKWLRFSKIGPSDNAKFIRLIESDPKGVLFFDVENAILKELNDKIFLDKELVTAIGNRYKEFFYENLISEPVLMESLVAKYSDFKSIRLAFSKDSPEIRAALEGIYQKAAKEFEAFVKSAGFEKQYTGQRGLAGDPQSWHLSGIGDTADQATTVSKRERSRRRAKSGSRSLYHFQQEASELEVVLKKVEALDSEIQGSLSSAFFVRNGNETVLDPKVIEIIVKTKVPSRDFGSFAQAVRTRFKNVFGQEVSDSQVELLKNYLSAVDQFSPGIYVAKREVIDLGEATNGALSFDFVGQNVKNLTGTIQALKATGGDATEAIRRARIAEQQVTESLNLRKEKLRKALDRALGSCRTLFTGDDGMCMPNRHLSMKERLMALSRLSGEVDLSGFRIVTTTQFYAGTKKTVSASKMSSLIAEIEDLQKKLKLDLEGLIPREDLQDRFIAVHVEAVQSGGKGNLVLYLDPKLSAASERKIVSEFTEIAVKAGFSKPEVQRVPPPSRSTSRSFVPRERDYTLKYVLQVRPVGVVCV